MNRPQRVCIYPKDIMIITGKSERYSRRLLKQIKQHLSKKEHQFVSIEEFSDYTGLSKETIIESLSS